jgi:rubrerythrin
LPKFTASQKVKEKARKLVTPKTDEIRAVRIGIEKETKSLAFYEKWSKRIKDGSFKEILQLLALEEKGHKALLQKEYKALLRASF